MTNPPEVECTCGFANGDTVFHQPWCQRYAIEDVVASPKHATNEPPNNVVPFVNWNSEKPEDIMQQVIDWLRWHKERNHTVHVIGCVVHSEPDHPDQRFYQPFFTPTPAEILHYAMFRVQQRSWEKLQEDPA